MYKLTVDLGLMAAEVPDIFVSRLKEWKRDGLVDLVEAGPRRESHCVPAPAPRARFGNSHGRSSPIPSSGNVTYKSLVAILFPYRDAAKLRMAEINQVISLIKHHETKNDFFVTADADRFINNGNQRSLREAFGILAMTPQETVERISRAVGTDE